MSYEAIVLIATPLWLIAWYMRGIDSTLRYDSMRREMDKLMPEDA